MSVTARLHRIRVSGLPAWLDVQRLLGPGPWKVAFEGDGCVATAQLERVEAADVQARLRRLGLGGRPLEVQVEPALPRPAVRAARSRDAARRRHTTPGWLHRGARAEGAGRFSLTPEALATAMAARAAGRTVVDACAGAGGNTVAFARAGCSVLALEPDPERRAELRHNLRIYGAEGQVRVKGVRLQDVLPGLSGDLLFADPPWGEDYDRLCCGLCDIPLLAVVLEAARGFRECWLKLPPSFDVAQLPAPAKVEAVFGAAEGDYRRVKFLWVRLSGADGGG